MKLNYGWIRELFRYSLAWVSSLSIILYIIFSTIGLFFPDERYETINDIFIQNENSGANNEWEIIIAQWWDDELRDEEFFGIKRSPSKEENISKIALNYPEEKINNTDQSLQDGNIFGRKENIFEENESNEFSWGNQFDIEKIISDLHLQKEKRVAVVAKQLWIDWKKEKLDYAKLAWIDWSYNWSLDQNQKIRNYLIANAQEIYKDKHWWNERDTLPLVAKADTIISKKKMNAKEITWQVTYNDVTLKVSAPTDSFPEWTVLKIKTLGDEDSTTTFDITFKEVILMTQVDNVEYDAPMASFDISFYDPNDTEFLEELQPAEWKSVSVTFDYADNNEFKNSEDGWFLAIYHIEDNDDTSTANLVSVKDSENINKDTKSDSMSIYANTLSVYILTIVSDLDEDVLENSRTITFDAGSGWYIVDSNDIVLSSTWIDTNAKYTWKILYENDEITLPDVEVTSWYTFSWWYNENEFLWEAWTKFKLWESSNSGTEQSDLNIYDAYKFVACLITEWLSWNTCTLNNEWISDLDILEEVSNTGNNINIEVYTPSEEEIEKYGEDVFVAYNWAINNWITTIDDVSQVKFNKKITRAELAKMMVAFMSWTLGKEPTTTWEVNYKDVDSEKLWDLAWYIQLAYQYQIMWINADWTPIEDFNPNKTVTRAEFATVLSRVLYGNIYNQNWKDYYEKHIEALEKANILSNTNPNLVEARWRIMTMLYNTQNNITNTDNQGVL